MMPCVMFLGDPLVETMLHKAPNMLQNPGIVSLPHATI
jgi:hypothetical protein